MAVDPEVAEVELQKAQKRVEACNTAIAKKRRTHADQQEQARHEAEATRNAEASQAAADELKEKEIEIKRQARLEKAEVDAAVAKVNRPPSGPEMATAAAAWTPGRVKARREVGAARGREAAEAAAEERAAAARKMVKEAKRQIEEAQAREKA